MARKLIIRLKNTTSALFSLDWLFFEEFNPISPSPNNIEELAANADQIVVVVPGEDVFLTHVKLPKLSQSQLAKALPYALEDQLTESPDILHFAVGVPIKSKPLAVAVVSKEKMDKWQQFLKEKLKQNFEKINVLIPDMLILPWNEDTYHVCIDQQVAIIRTEWQGGFSIEKENLFSILQLTFNRVEQIKPKHIKIYGSEEPVLSDEQAKQLGIAIEHEIAQKNLLEFNVDQQDIYPLNLLQGVYAFKRQTISLEHILTACLAIIGAWLVFSTITLVTSFILLHQVEKKLDKEMEAIYQSAFPNTKLPNNPKVAMQNTLNDLRAKHADSTFIRLVSVVDPYLRPLIQNGLNLKNANFKNNQLILDISTNDLGALDKLQQTLEGLGLKVVMSNAQRSATGSVETQLSIEEINE